MKITPVGVLLAAGIAFPALGREIIVEPGGGGEFTEIQPAIDAAAEGDTVLVRLGEYVINEPISFEGKAITVAGSGAERTTIRMSESPADPLRASVVVFSGREGPGSVLSGFTLTGGRGTAHVVGSGSGFPKGAGVYVAGRSSTLVDCTITGNVARYGGGGVYFGQGASATLTRCTITGNAAGHSGGGVYCEGNSSATLTQCTITGNVAGEDGGGVFCSAISATPATLIGCTIAGNSATRGGGLYVKGAVELAPSPMLTGCILWDNAGGSIYLAACAEDPHASCDALEPAITYSCVEGPDLWPGEGNIHSDPLFCGWGDRGEVYVDGTSAGPGDGSEQDPYPDLASALRYSLALSRESPCLGARGDGTNMGAGHGVCDTPGQPARLVHVAAGTYSWEVLSHHVSLSGAGEDVTTLEGTVHGLRTGAVLSDVTVTGGRSVGILIGEGEAPEIIHSTVSANDGDGLRGGAPASPRLTRCTITGNSNHGVFLTADREVVPILTDCTISANGKTGVRLAGSPAVLTNCLIIENRLGGARLSGSAATLRNCTISGNTGIASGSGIWADGASPTFENCIIWGNPFGSFGFSDRTTPSVTHSCVETAEVLDGEGNINVDPRFVREGAFEHPQNEIPVIVDPGDYRLRSDSPCIDTGTPEGAPITDIEGHGRPCGDGVDMGAYESGECPPPTPFRRGDVNADGRTDVTDAVLVLLHLFDGGSEPSCSKSADADDSGALDMMDPALLLAWLFSGGSPPAPPFPGCGFDTTIDELTCESFEGCAR